MITGLTRSSLVLLAAFCCNAIMAAPMTLQDFEARADDTGSVPVIVQLKVPEKARAKPKASQGWMNLNDYLDAIQNRAISNLGWVNFNDVVKLRTEATLVKSVSKEQMQDLLSSDDVDVVYPDEKRTLSLTESVQMIGLPQLSNAARLGSGVSVAVIDTGVDSSHSFFSNKVVGEACFSRMSQCPNGGVQMIGNGAGQPCELGVCSHGTHVAGIAAGANEQMRGAAPGANVVALQVFSEVPEGLRSFDSDILQALEWVYLNQEAYDIKAVNLSLGGGLYRNICEGARTYEGIVNLLTESGIAVIAATGNDFAVGSISAPACLTQVISVGSIEKNGQVSEFSNVNNLVSIVAPGGGIISAVPGGGFAGKSGTSMATPHVAGAWAALASQFPEAGLERIRAALLNSGATFFDERVNRNFPMLRLDRAFAALEAELGSQPAKPKPEEPSKTDQQNDDEVDPNSFFR